MLFVSTFDVWVCITHCSTVIALMCYYTVCVYDVYSELFKCGVF